MPQFFLRFAHIPLLVGALFILLVAFLVRFKWYCPVYYSYSLGTAIKNAGKESLHPHKKIFYTIRVLFLSLLAFLIGQPQLVDPSSKINIEGIDIVLALDVSGSMKFQDYDDNHTSRLDVAKKEAIRFIHKRTNDAIGLIIFGRQAVSRCPITFDKKMLTDIVDHVHIGIIDEDGTALVTGMVCAANRLKSSKATSKIMIVLTDGEPSQGDMNPEIIIKIAHELNIKIYTVGIGSLKEEYMMHPLYGMLAKPKINVDLLTHIAQQTGGQFFMAHNATDMRSIYDIINTLETTKHDVPIFSRYIELIYPVGLAACICIIIELFLSCFMWFCL